MPDERGKLLEAVKRMEKVVKAAKEVKAELKHKQGEIEAEGSGNQ